MFGIKGRDTFNNPMSNRTQLIRTLKKWWLKYFPALLGLITILAVVCTGYVWYIYVYTKDLTPEEESIYINEKQQEVVFRRKKFDEIKDGIMSRAEKFNAEKLEYNDIFYHKKISTEEQTDGT